MNFLLKFSDFTREFELNMGLNFFSTSQENWFSLSPLRVGASEKVDAIKKRIGKSVTNNFS